MAKSNKCGPESEAVVAEATKHFPKDVIEGSSALYAKVSRKCMHFLSKGAQKYVKDKRRKYQNCVHALNARIRRSLQQDAQQAEINLFKLKHVLEHCFIAWNGCPKPEEFIRVAQEIKELVFANSVVDESSAERIMLSAVTIFKRVKHAFEVNECVLHMIGPLHARAAVSAVVTGFTDTEALVLSSHPDLTALVVTPPRHPNHGVPYESIFNSGF